MPASAANSARACTNKHTHDPCWSPGKSVWSAPLKEVESQAVLLPDLEGDSVPELLVATLPADKVTFSDPGLRAEMSPP